MGTEASGAADDMSDLNEEVKTLGEQLEELSGNFLNNRAAGRAVRDSLRGIREATREYIKENGDLDGAFKARTKSGDEFAALLDDLATDLQDQVDASALVSGSYKETMQTWRASRDTLIDVATQLGMTKEEARKYAEQILGTPELIKTYFQTDTAAARAAVSALQQQLDSIDRFIPVNIHVSRSGDNGEVPYVSGGTQTPKPPKGDPDGRMTYGGGGGASSTWTLAGQQLGTRAPRQAAGAGSVTVVREGGPLIGELKIELRGGATRADAHRLATAVVEEVALAQRSNRWTED